MGNGRVRGAACVDTAACIFKFLRPPPSQRPPVIPFINDLPRLVFVGDTVLQSSLFSLLLSSV